MKTIKNLSLILFLFITACRTTQVFESSAPDEVLILTQGNIYINGPYFEKYIKSFGGSETGFIEEGLIFNYFNKDLSEYRLIKKNNSRRGQIVNSKQVGYWKTKNYKSIVREEYFQMGLRDSIYRIYNAAGDTIYSTYFNMGTGVEKDYHRNGQLYYEIELKDGYFTDTLRIHDEQGRIAEKLYFEKDSLVYYKSFSYPELSDCEEEVYFFEEKTSLYKNGPYFRKYKDSKEHGPIYQFLSINKDAKKMLTALNILYFGARRGDVKGGKQNGLWQSKRDGRIFREESFKKGLRDGTYRIYNATGDTIYSTCFDMGTGVEKDYHENGQLYYEIELKDGYFTDTLRIHDKLGHIVEKLYFEKDSLVYYESFHSKLPESEATIYTEGIGYVYINGPYYEKKMKCLKGDRDEFQTLCLNKYTQKISGIFDLYSNELRIGRIREGKQDGFWQSTRNGSVFRKEYFQKGLRNGTYLIYNAAGNTIYSTSFTMGTGVEKDYHENGQLYYEIELKDGYFTDTLRIYDDQGRMAEKLYFEKDSLVFHKSFSYPELSGDNSQSRIEEEALYINGLYFEKKINKELEKMLELPNVKRDVWFLSSASLTKGYWKYYFGSRVGDVKERKQDGLWQSMRDGIVLREEYFQMGLRDGAYRVYNAAGDTIYSTYFNMGTGVEKDYHENGQLYYEIELKDGYFTDTLRIYDKQGRIAEKLYFEKDSLAFYQSFSYPEE